MICKVFKNPFRITFSRLQAQIVTSQTKQLPISHSNDVCLHRLAMVQLGRCISRSSSLPSSLTRLYSTHSAASFFTPYGWNKVSDKHSPNGRMLQDAELNIKNKQLIASWDDGQSQVYPFVWLRDNCRCSKCFHPVSMARLSSAYNLNVEIIAKSIKIPVDGSTLTVLWEDGHESEFPSWWLREYRFDNSPPDQLMDLKYRPWGADVDLQSFDFTHLLEDDQSLHDWLFELVTVGIAVVKNTPTKVGQLRRLGKRVSFLRKCNYGPTFQVKTKLDPSNVAYTSGALQLHTDLAYYMREPEIQMLHCIEQAAVTGGESTFSDGFKVAQDLKRVDPEAFRLLATYQFEYFDIGKDCYGDFYLYARHPTIRLNEDGEVESVTISDHSRDPMLRAPIDLVLPIYRALNKYCNMLTEPENTLTYKMENGDIMTFNNCRALHGRNSFQVTEASGRHLEGGYLEWDEVKSRLRVLVRQLQNQKSS